jgi:predicted alpha/beta superfamily hydrolase
MPNAIIHQLLAPGLNHSPRTIRIWLPKDYEEQPELRYPVLYMHDGQTAADPSPFSGYSWNAPQTIAEMQRSGDIGGLILVGVDNGEDDRIQEYTCGTGPKGIRGVKRYLKGPWQPKGDVYGSFLIDVVKTFIDANYRTLPDRIHTGIAGSSCGGNISLELWLRHPEVFGVVGAFSPAYWVIAEEFFPRLEQTNLPIDAMIYHDMGGKESKWFPMKHFFAVHRFHKMMKIKGYDEKHLKLVIDPNATHTELFWQSRFPDFITFAFGKNDSPEV